jgi:hypothetical protein
MDPNPRSRKEGAREERRGPEHMRLCFEALPYDGS